MPNERPSFSACVFVVTMASLASCGGAESASHPGPTDGGDADVADAADHADSSTDAATEAEADAADGAPSTYDGETCALDTTYAYGLDGGLVAIRDHSTLTPPATYSHTRAGYAADGGPTSRSCSVTVAGCGAGSPSASELAVLLTDLHTLDVEAAFAAGDAGAPVLFGVDLRATDGTVFIVERGDGRAFAVGTPCGNAAGCVPPPPGVATLVADLQALDQSELANAACATL